MSIEDAFFFDERAAEGAVRFFERVLLHTKGEWAGQPFVLQPWQRDDVIRPLFGWKRRSDGRRRYRYAYLSWPRKNGKALSLDTRLPTPDGWVTIGDIRAGAVLFDECGEPCRVTAVTEVMQNRPCYEVEFSDGAKIVADAEHQWYTDARRTGGPGRIPLTFEDHIRTTEQIGRSLTVDSPYNIAHGRVEWNHRVQVAAALQLPPVELPIPPYVLGAWLGDGHTANARITIHDDDLGIAERIRAEGVPLDEVAGGRRNGTALYRMGDGDKSQEARNHSVQARLRAMGVLGNKRIPQVYMRASVAQRTALLQGLMDTDGYASKAGQCEFTTISMLLAEDMRELVVSLGMKCSIIKHRATLNGRDCGPKFRVLFAPDNGTSVFGLERKQARLKREPGTLTRASTRQIVAVRPVPSSPVRCIEVDSPSHLYLAGPTMIPTHNSTLASGLALQLLMADGEGGAEVYSAASDRAQAGIVFDQAKAFVQESRLLRDVGAKVYKNEIHAPSHSRYKVLSADAFTKHGLNPHGVVFDELHAQPNRELFDVLRTGMGARTQPLFVMITTAGYDMQSICAEQYEYARQVREGTIIDPGYFVHITEAEREDDWTDPAVWRKANPSLGVTVSEEFLAGECKRALASPSSQNAFRQLYLNQWVSQESRWLDMGAWMACSAAAPDLTGRLCYVGLDLASVGDVAAAVALFPPQEEGEPWWVLCKFYVPADNLLERGRQNRAPYGLWREQGWLTATSGNVIDYATIERDVMAWGEQFDVRQVGMDPWNAQQMSQNLTAAGLEVWAVRQTFAGLSGATKELERLVLAMAVGHGGNPVLRWMVDNVTIVRDANANMKPDKKRSRNKIDGVVGLLNALDRAMRKERTGPSVYENRGVLEIG